LDKEFFTIEGEELSLNDIEHRILRPIWQDPKITMPWIAPAWDVQICGRLLLPSSTASCFWNKAQINTLIIHVVQKKQKNFGCLKFLNGIRMILAVMKQEFWFINRNM